MRLVERQTALTDLIELADYLEQEAGLEMAERFIDAAEETFEHLARMPQIGTSRTFYNPALAGIRMWRVKGFEKHLIFYHPLKGGVEILRVVHGARDYKRIFEDDEAENLRTGMKGMD